MKIVKVSAIPMSAPVPEDKRHRTDLGTKVKGDATLIRVETNNGLTGLGTLANRLRTPNRDHFLGAGSFRTQETGNEFEHLDSTRSSQRISE